MDETKPHIVEEIVDEIMKNPSETITKADAINILLTTASIACEHPNAFPKPEQLLEGITTSVALGILVCGRPNKKELYAEYTAKILTDKIFEKLHEILEREQSKKGADA